MRLWKLHPLHLLQKALDWVSYGGYSLGYRRGYLDATKTIGEDSLSGRPTTD